MKARREEDAVSARVSITVGTSVGLTIGSITFAVVGWPFADAFGGKLFVAEALRRGPPERLDVPVADADDATTLLLRLSNGLIGRR